MPMQIRRTATPNAPPTGLAEGQLGVEMAGQRPRMWVGVPTAVDASGRRLLVPSGAPSGTTAPATPIVGDLWFDTTNNELKVWNGSAWVISLEDAPSDGTPYVRQDGAWESLTIETMPGVTDGSDPAPGFVGERLAQTNNVTGAISNDWFTQLNFGTISSFLVPAGDWDVMCTAQVSICTQLWPNGTDVNGPGVEIDPATVTGAPTQYLMLTISPSTIVSPNTDVIYWPQGWSVTRNDMRPRSTHNLGPVRVSSAANTSMLLRISCWRQTLSFYYFVARRVR